jgi:multidrug efflux pump
MRIWIDDQNLESYGLTISDIQSAFNRENVEIPAGRVESDTTEFTVRSLTGLQSVQDFENLIIGNFAGALIHLRDVARIEIGAESARDRVRVNTKVSLVLGVIRQSKANSLDVAESVRAEIEKINRDLPAGVHLKLATDSSRFIKRSIDEVRSTIFEAGLLVVLVIFVFLRDLRATIIPATAILVSSLGTFTFLHLAGFTINTFTLMGITLAIGIVVDDAIVVLENIKRWLETGMAPLEAARRGMAEISFAVVAATASAVAAFLPLVFLTDMTGRLVREFAFTVAAAIAISGFVALTLSPALCALFLKASSAPNPSVGKSGVFTRLLGAYDRLLRVVARAPWFFVAFGGLWLLGGLALFGAVDTELLPSADRSEALIETYAPEGTTVEAMEGFQLEAEKIALDTPEVLSTVSFVGQSLGSSIVNAGFIFATLADPDDRELSQHEVVVGLTERLRDIAGIQSWVYDPTPVSGTSSGSAVELEIQGPDLMRLAEIGDAIKKRVEALPPGYNDPWVWLELNKPQLEVEIDRERANDVGVSIRDIADTLQILLAGREISTFKLDGETYDVIAQLDRSERNDPRDLLGLFVRSEHGDLIRLSGLIKVHESVAPAVIQHSDRERSVRFTVDPDPELVSQGEAIKVVNAIVKDVLSEHGSYYMNFTGRSEQFASAGSAMAFAYLLALLFVYLILAAQFESFIHPITILIAVALSFTGALITLFVTQTTLNFYSAIGLVMLVGLVTKNSILIVEFANQQRDRGASTVDAAIEGAKSRFRPVLMTALATMAGILPIALGQGAGGDARAPLGIAVVGGVFFSTALTFVIVPAAYIVVGRLQERLSGKFATNPVPNLSET